MLGLFGFRVEMSQALRSDQYEVGQSGIVKRETHSHSAQYFTVQLNTPWCHPGIRFVFQTSPTGDDDVNEDGKLPYVDHVPRSRGTVGKKHKQSASTSF